MHLAPLIYSLLGGILPALVWLFFWLHEDSKQPEPNRLILKTFILGMVSVILVIPIQKWFGQFWPELIVVNLLVWALLEEVLKFFAGYFGGLHSVEDNEPIDPLIYMITAALGFVALENTLFLLEPLLGNDILSGIVTGNLRFVGAGLLHVISSAIIGVALSLSFYRSKRTKAFSLAMGAVLAVTFHTIFNTLIIIGGPHGITFAFALVWISAAILLLTFERIKSIAPNL